MTYIVIFEPSLEDKAREFDRLWAESRHNSRGNPMTLFDYYYGQQQ